MNKPTADDEARVKELTAEVAQLKARIRAAQLRLDGGNDCFDSLEEVVDAVVQSRGTMRSQASEITRLTDVLAQSRQRAIEVVEVKRDEWQSELDRTDVATWAIKVRAANEILRELSGES